MPGRGERLRILAIDTTTQRGSVALVAGGEVMGEVRFSAQGGHSRHVLPAVGFLLDATGVAIAGVGAFCVAVGPGSFTGLRVGISTVQGLALAAQRPCVGLSALDALAARIRGCADYLVAMMDAFRGEVCAALYDADARPRGPFVVGPLPAFLTGVPETAAFIGDGAEAFRSEILTLRPGARFPERSPFLAGTLGRLAAKRLAAGQGVAPEALRPLYFRDADVRRPIP